MRKSIFSWFTLAELIIVITILVILSTIWFVSFQSFNKDARDSQRLATLNNLETWLSLYNLKTSLFPEPDNIYWTWNINNQVLSYVWEFWESVSKKLGVSKVPKDPLSDVNYVYWTTSDYKSYQISWILESHNYTKTNLVNNAYADWILKAKVTWNYKNFLKYNSWSEVFISNIPSLLFSNTWWTNLLSTTTYFIVDKSTNLPYTRNWIKDQSIRQKDGNTIIREVTKNATSTLTWINITWLNNNNIWTYFTWEVLRNFNTIWLDITNTWAILESLKNNILWNTQSTTTSSTWSSPTYNNCTFNSSPVTHSNSVTAYQTSSVAFWQTCVSEQRTCNNWVLSWSYTNASCTVSWATWTFTLSQTSVTTWTNVTITNNCSTAPTSYTSSNTSVATISWNTITTLSAWTTNITPVWWACWNSTAKTLTVTAPSNSCNSTLPANSTTTTWSPSSVNQAWQTTNSANACHFVCNANFWFNWTSCVSATNCATWLEYITLPNWQVWSCKNLWATTVRDWTTAPNPCNDNCNPWVWYYYQWWRNDTGFTNSDSSPPFNSWWEAQNDGKWWWSTWDTKTVNWAWTTSLWRQWPCPTWYHVPSVKEWQDMCNNVVGSTCTDGMSYNSLISTKLRLPFGGLRDLTEGEYDRIWEYWYYWSSSPVDVHAHFVTIHNLFMSMESYDSRAYAFNVRCLKN